MSNFSILSQPNMTGITVGAPDDGFNEDMANAFLLLLRGGLGNLDTSQEWQYDAFQFIRAQEGGLSQFFGTAEYAAAQKISSELLSYNLHFHQLEEGEHGQMMFFRGEIIEYGLDVHNISVPVELVGVVGYEGIAAASGYSGEYLA